MEFASLFDRSLGEFAEVVQKQMFLLPHEDEVYALRPEATAQVARAYIENNLDKTAGLVKFYYIGPMFRRERPQKGRLRQFHHIGCEAIGSGHPYLDVEIVALAQQLLVSLGIQGYKIKLNSLGCNRDKEIFTKELEGLLKVKKTHLCTDCQNRLSRNILRVLDCKNETCRQIVEGLALSYDYLCADCQEAFDLVKSGLDSLGVPYEVTPSLVRGLDYYTKTVFEISHPYLGAQDAVGAGGRYDDLIQQLGGPDKPAVGFALGLERVILAKKENFLPAKEDLVFLILLGDEAKKKGLVLLNELRANGILADTDYENRSLKAALRKANSQGASWCVILGDNELVNNKAILKDMDKGRQQDAQLDEVLPQLKKLLNKDAKDA